MNSCHMGADLVVGIMVGVGQDQDYSIVCIFILVFPSQRIYFLASQERRFEVLSF